MLRVGGLTPLSATDYPGQLSAVVFCQGCPWRCGYCHNAHLQESRSSGEIAWRRIVRFLEHRKGLLDAVVFSGGEPTLQPGLAAAMREAKALGFRIGLHTAGIYPRRLAAVLPLLDWVGMDLKAPFRDYEAITGIPGSGIRAEKSFALLMQSGVECELRTTVAPGQLSEEALRSIAALAPRREGCRYTIQPARNAIA